MKTTPTTLDLSLMPCYQLKGVGKRTAEHLARLGIHCVQDLLFHLPSRYQDRTRVYCIRELSVGDHAVIEGVIENVTTPRVGKTRLLCRLKDATGFLQIRFFYVNALQRESLKSGVKIRCFGEVRIGPQGLEMIHPEYHQIDIEKIIPIDEKLTPIYPTTQGLSQLTFRKLTEQALQFLNSGGLLHDILPSPILQQFTFPTLKDALTFVHRPPKHAELNLLTEGKHVSQKRLVFEELLAHRLSLLNLKKSFQIQHAIALQHKLVLTEQFFSILPFALTTAQRRVIEEIMQDIQKPHPMLRLVQGDVGSGKTVVAAFALLQAVENGYQAAVLAPTELLAEQHFQTFVKWFSPLQLKVVMLTGSMKAAERRDALNGIETGSANVVVGTHAIFQKEINFAKLALIVVDEQHRFGVEQRALLREKGMNQGLFPHQLIMTATPIPRTLAMSVYADLDYSIIDELPAGRQAITTTVISNERRQEVLTRIREACQQGRQIYWVCTLIEESDVLQCQAAEDTAKELTALLHPLKIGLLHGRMKNNEKDEVMSSFKKGEIQLLVATTVIEVGVDVPNASLMVIENAERLGLAQLHQLRGRVGRGAIASYCVLMYQPPLSHLAKERLAIMKKTTDGFKVAEHDLTLRGAGEVLGTRQTGDISLRIADLVRDSDLLTSVQQAATILINDHPDLIDPLIKRWLGQKEKFGHV